jgi:preprotein translocase subunit SecF
MPRATASTRFKRRQALKRLNRIDCRVTGFTSSRDESECMQISPDAVSRVTIHYSKGALDQERPKSRAIPMRDLGVINELNIDFMGMRRAWVIVSGALMVIFFLSMLIRGFNLGLDFTGGTVLEVGYQNPAELSDVRAALEDKGFTGATIQHFGALNDVLIRLAPQEGEEASAQLSEEVFKALSEAVGGQVELRRVEFVGPQVGEELREQGGLAVLFALIGILIYVALRFEWRFAVGAIAATMHDALFVVGIFSLFQIQFDLTVLAAVLAVIGYSLNDTIVIFDRVRESFRKIRKGTVLEITNIAINQTMSRTIITSGTTLLVLISLYIFGGEALSGFSLALLIGVFVGTYSTIFIATATVIMLGVSRADLLPVPKEGAEAGNTLP